MEMSVRQFVRGQQCSHKASLFCCHGLREANALLANAQVPFEFSSTRIRIQARFRLGQQSCLICTVLKSSWILLDCWAHASQTNRAFGKGVREQMLGVEEQL